MPRLEDRASGKIGLVEMSPTALKEGTDVLHIKFQGWNAFSTRFVRPPKFMWEHVTNEELRREAATYRVGVAGAGQRHAAWFETKEPVFDFAPLWPSLPHGRVDIIIHAFDREGQQVDETAYSGTRGSCYAPKSFYKVPGWDGRSEEPLDWEKTVERNMAFLLGPPKDDVKPYELGLPRHVWSAAESPTGRRERDRLTYPSRSSILLCSLFRFAESYPGHQLAGEAARQARQYGDWLFDNHLPDDWAFSRFPYSTLVGGAMDEDYGGHIEGKLITLDMAATVGSSMIKMTDAAGDNRYLDYAEHLGHIFAETQREDGSWPARVDPRTGKPGGEADEYGVGTIRIAKFLSQLERKGENPAYRRSRKKAESWTLTNPVKTNRWQSAFEDVGSQEPYRNLSAMDALVAIRYLIHFKHEIRNAVEIALEINDFVEDQFVVWNTEESNIFVQCPTPTVLEQYTCYHPMEVHTGNWLLSLAALHHATAEGGFLAKGVAAANSICRGEHLGGVLSTWGVDERFGCPLIDYDNWPSCNAYASDALMLWSRYYGTVKAGSPQIFDLIGFFGL